GLSAGVRQIEQAGAELV
ncbi:hypothetical protein, partial [Aeromonas hydrophila]